MEVHEALTNYLSASEEDAVESVLSLCNHPELNQNKLEELIDLIWLFDMQLSEQEGAEKRQKLHQLIQQMLDRGMVSEDVLKERLEADFMEAVGLIASESAWTKKTIRLNTMML